MRNGYHLAILWLALAAFFVTLSPRPAYAETTLLNETQDNVQSTTSTLTPKTQTQIIDPAPAPVTAPQPQTVGQPGFGESLIPVWGSGRAAVDDFQNGHYLSGTLNTALAVSDVFLVKAAWTAGAKLLAKGASVALAKKEGAQLATREGEQLATSGCFAAGTMVWTANGMRPIESIAVGDVVLSRPDDGEGAVEYRPVVRTFVYEDKPVVDIGLESVGVVEHVVATTEHPFWVHGRGFVAAAELAPGDAIETTSSAAEITTATGAASSRLLRVVSLESLPTRSRVFNFEVDHDHTYFVGHLGAWVHNACVIQSGGHTIEKSTAKKLNEMSGENLSSRDWGRALESLKKDNLLRNSDHGRILSDGSYELNGTVVDNLLNHLP